MERTKMSTKVLDIKNYTLKLVKGTDDQYKIYTNNRGTMLCGDQLDEQFVKLSDVTELESSEAERIGQAVLEHLNKLMKGEHKGHAVVVPIRAGDEGMTRITIDLPTLSTTRLKYDKHGYISTEWLHYTWVPDSQVYVLDDFVYKEKKT